MVKLIVWNFITVYGETDYCFICIVSAICQNELENTDILDIGNNPLLFINNLDKYWSELK